MSNYDPQTLENLARNVPRPSKIEVLEVPGSLNSRKRRPRPAKRCPRSTQEGPRAAQECPKAGQVAPKSWPRRPQTLPKPSAVTSKTSFQHNLCWQLCAKGSWSDFVSFFARATSLRYVKNLEKPRKNCGFCTSQAFSHWKLARAKKTRKMRPWDLQNSSQTLLKPSKIDPGAVQNPQKPAQSDKKRSKMRQMLPRGPKSEK